MIAAVDDGDAVTGGAVTVTVVVGSGEAVTV